MRSRVTPGVSCTTAARLWVSRLISVDLPTFGKPTIATVPAISRGASTSSASSSSLIAVAPRRGVRASCISTRKSKSSRILPCRISRRLLVALAALRQALEADRLAPGERDRVEVPGLPRLRAVDRDRDHGHVLLQRDHRGAGLERAGDAALLTGALGEEAEREAVAHDPAHRPHGVAVGLAASHREGAEPADERPQAGDAMRLDLRHEVDRARAGGAERRRVDPVEVVAGDHETARQRDALLAVDLHPAGELDGRADRRAADGPDLVRGRAQVAHSLLHERLDPVDDLLEAEERSCRPRPRRRPGACWRRRARRGAASRRRAPRPRSRRARRGAATRGPAGRRRARPSARRAARRRRRCRAPRSPSRPARRAARWRSRITSRTSWCRATVGTEESISGCRISAVTSWPGDRRRRRPRRTRRDARRASATSAVTSSRSTP